ncbi:MAG: hypothetical protein ACI8RD_000784 [Bacillariaceae sp.]|jgi:hypothetical protein
MRSTVFYHQKQEENKNKNNHNVTTHPFMHSSTISLGCFQNKLTGTTGTIEINLKKEVEVPEV